MGRKPNGNGCIVLRTDGRWQGSLQLNGQRRSVYGRSRAEVQEKMAALQLTTVTLGSLPESHTLGELFSRWLDVASDQLKPRTLVDYRTAAETIMKHLGGKTQLDKIRPDHIQAMYSRLKDKQRWAHYLHQVIHRALRMAVLWQWITHSPADRVLPPRYKAKRKEIWSKEELSRFLALSHRWHPLWLILASCGLRIGEARALKWNDVDAKTATLQVERSIQTINGVDVVTTPKTQSGIRRISLPAQAVAALEDWNTHQATELMALGKRNEENWLWTSDEGELVTYWGLKSAFYRDTARAGLKGSMHGLRHFHASLLLSNGLPVAETARRLGHANPHVTLTIYAHAFGNDQEAADITERILAGNIARSV